MAYDNGYDRVLSSLVFLIIVSGVSGQVFVCRTPLSEPLIGIPGCLIIQTLVGGYGKQARAHTPTEIPLTPNELFFGLHLSLPLHTARHTHTHTHTHKHTYPHTAIRTHTHAGTQARRHAGTHAGTHAQTHTNTYIQAYTDINTHTHTHTHTQPHR